MSKKDWKLKLRGTKLKKIYINLYSYIEKKKTSTNPNRHEFEIK